MLRPLPNEFRVYKKSDADEGLEPRPRLWKNDRKTVQCFFRSHLHRFALCGNRCEEKTSAIYPSARFVFVKIKIRVVSVLLSLVPKVDIRGRPKEENWPGL